MVRSTTRVSRFAMDDDFRGSMGLNGGVRSHMRTGLRNQTGINRANWQIQAF
jgi:hypothetical protein